MSTLDSIQEMMDRDARINRAKRISLLAERLLVRTAAKFREAPADVRAHMMREAFEAAEALEDEHMRRFEAAKSPRPRPRAVSVQVVDR